MSPSDPPLIDARVARWAAQLVTPIRPSDPDEVAQLRRDVEADLPAIDAAARRWTQLGEDLPPTTARVLGRIGWVDANLDVLAGAFDGLKDRIRGNRAIAARVLGTQVGALLGLLSTKVLGQFVLPLDRAGSGELVVVGPNLLDLGAEFGDLAADIRRTVLVHEVTHRLQFDGVDWLGAELRGLLDEYLSHARLDATALLDSAARLPAAIADARETGTVQPLIEAVLTPEQADVMRRAQGLMSLLEGHGNAAMFAGSEAVVGDAEGVRRALESRRGDVTSKILTVVAGMDMKRRQYAEGEAFVREVVDRVGISGLNRAFDRPELLPTVDEIRTPSDWLERTGAA